MNSTYEIKEPSNCIGAWVVISHGGCLHVGTVMDLVSGTGTPKRIRIQRGCLQGEVVQPHEYKFKSFLTATDVDP